MLAPPRTIPSSVLSDVRWLRSSYSTGANNCVETARLAAYRRPDCSPCATARPRRARTALLPDAWARFVTAVH